MPSPYYENPYMAPMNQASQAFYYPYRYQYGNPEYMNPMQNTINQQNRQLQNQQQSTLTCVQVPDLEYAKKVFVSPNQTVYMLSQNAPEIYAKSADAMGVGPIRCFKMVEFDPEAEKTKEIVNNQMETLVTREEFNIFANNVTNALNSFQQTLMQNQEQNQQQNAGMNGKTQTKKQSKSEQQTSNSLIPTNT